MISPFYSLELCLLSLSVYFIDSTFGWTTAAVKTRNLRPLMASNFKSRECYKVYFDEAKSYNCKETEDTILLSLSLLDKEKENEVKIKQLEIEKEYDLKTMEAYYMKMLNFTTQR